MTERRLKNALGGLLIASHLLIVALLMGLYVADGLLFEDMTTAIGLIVPMFTAYTAVIVKYFVDNRTMAKDASPRMSMPFVILTLAVPIAFVTFISVAIFLLATNVAFESFEQFKIVLALLEVAYGAYLVKLVDALYPRAT